MIPGENRIKSRFPHGPIRKGDRDNRNNRQKTACFYAVFSRGKKGIFIRKREKRERFPYKPPAPPHARKIRPRVCVCAPLCGYSVFSPGRQNQRLRKGRTTEKGMPMNATPECWTCRFFRHDDEVEYDDARKAHESGSAINGHYHRHNPVAIKPAEDDRVVNYGYWPVVLSDDWCGEHQPKKAEVRS